MRHVGSISLPYLLGGLRRDRKTMPSPATSTSNGTSPESWGFGSCNDVWGDAVWRSEDEDHERECGPANQKSNSSKLEILAAWRGRVSGAPSAPKKHVLPNGNQRPPPLPSRVAKTRAEEKLYKMMREHQAMGLHRSLPEYPTGMVELGFFNLLLHHGAPNIPRGGWVDGLGWGREVGRGTNTSVHAGRGQGPCLYRGPRSSMTMVNGTG